MCYKKIKKNKSILKECNIYVIRIKKHQSSDTYFIEPGYPCDHCMKIINKYKINFKNIINLI